MFKPGNALFNYLQKGCESWPSVMTQWKDNMCRGPLIGAQITVPMRPLEENIVNALGACVRACVPGRVRQWWSCSMHSAREWTSERATRLHVVPC